MMKYEHVTKETAQSADYKYLKGLEAILAIILQDKECYGDSDVPMTQDALDLKKAIKITWEELQLHAYETYADGKMIDVLTDFKATLREYKRRKHLPIVVDEVKQ
jgi:hypothetical protein